MPKTERTQRLHQTLTNNGWIISEKLVDHLLTILRKQMNSEEEFLNIFNALISAIRAEPQRPMRWDFLSADFLKLFPN